MQPINDTKLNIPKLWNKNFTILVVGSFISVMSYSCASFAMGLLVFDETNSVFMYALTLIASMLPRIVSPMVAGTYFDRHSRRKAIFTLDYIYTGIFATMAVLLFTGSFEYWLFLVIAVLLGCADGAYMVAFDSLFPLLTTTATSRKAYSVNSMVYPIASFITYPLTLLAYDSIGALNLFILSAVLSLITATVETQIKVREPHLMQYEAEKQSKLPPSPKETELNSNGIDILTTVEKRQRASFLKDLKEGIAYLSKEKGLMAITVYFFIISLCGAVMSTLMLPYFRDQYVFTLNGTQVDGMWAYLIVFGSSTFGRIVGANVQYRVKFAKEKRFNIAVIVYIATNVFTIVLFHLPIWLMCALMLVEGTLSVTSYNIRISSTQNYIPDNKRGRFNGTFMFFNMIGSIIGQFIAGAVGDLAISVPLIISVTFAVNLAFVFIIIIPNAKHIRPIYNSDL